MTLFDFLRRIRAEGADITKLKIRIPETPGGWAQGFKIKALRGNRLSISTEQFDDFQLQAGHLALRCSIAGIRPNSLSKRKRLSDRCKDAIMIIDLINPTFT